MIKSFTELTVWQKAHQLVLAIYKITSKFPVDERFGLITQMRRAAVSIPSNIAEGFRRYSKRDSVNFYTIAQGSLEELRYQTILARDLAYIPEPIFKDLALLEEDVSKLLTSWKKSQSPQS